MDENRPWAGAAGGRYGSLGEYGEWNIALDHYYWDRLEPAYNLALSLGVGPSARLGQTYRLIEAEHLTRQRSQRARVNEWLEIETILEEAGEPSELGLSVQAVCDEVADRLGWEHGAATLVSVLAEEVDAPWAVGRYGYMVDKYPFDKVCVPRQALSRHDYFQRVVAHEYAHVISLNLSGGLVPRWLDEAIAQVAGRDEDPQARREFARGRAPWLNAHDLELAFGAEREDAIGGQRLWLAYQQAAQIGRYLVERDGERKLGDLLRGFSNNSLWTDLRLRLTGQPEVDEALREVYGLSTREVFAKTFDSL